MRRSLILALLAGCAGPAAPAQAPDFQVTQPDGTRIQGSSLWQGRAVLLVFMTSW